MQCSVCGYKATYDFEIISTPSMLIGKDRLVCNNCGEQHAESIATLRNFLDTDTLEAICEDVRKVIMIFDAGRYTPIDAYCKVPLLADNEADDLLRRLHKQKQVALAANRDPKPTQPNAWTRLLQKCLPKRLKLPIDPANQPWMSSVQKSTSFMSL